MLKLKRAGQLFITLFFVLGGNSIFANEVELLDNKKYELSICAVLKNEERFIKEWIEYHCLAGVDHFYLYDLKSRDASRSIIAPYVEEGIVTLVDWPDNVKGISDENSSLWILSNQLPAYENAIKKAVSESKWLVIVDVNEFLTSSGTNIKDVLEKYDHCAGLILTSECFDAFQNEVIPNKLLIQSTEITQLPKRDKRKEVTKTIFKPELCTAFVWPPYQVVFKNLQTAQTLSKQEMRVNHYINREPEAIFYAKKKPKLEIDSHFVSEEEINRCLSMDFVLEDQEKAIHRFVPQMLSKMGYEQENRW